MNDLPPPQDDGQVIPEVGDWSTHKHHFLSRYIHAFTTAMHSKKWTGLHYIDLFAGAGIERIKSGRLEWGSPLLAAQSLIPFSQLHLCELDPSKYKALALRLAKFPQPQQPQLLNDDANKAVIPIVSAIPRGTLSLAFIDPYGLHCNFETLRILARRRIDLILFFPDHLDALRNWRDIYSADRDSNLDRVLGTSEWRKIFDDSQSSWADQLSSLYTRQIGTLGYKHFEFQRIFSGSGRMLYKLIFCSAHQAGAKIWQGISAKDAGGQMSMQW